MAREAYPSYIDQQQRKLSLHNRLNVITFENGAVKVIMKQLAGIIARRGVVWKQQLVTVAWGESIGLGELSYTDRLTDAGRVSTAG